MPVSVPRKRDNLGRDSAVFRRKAKELKASDEGAICCICGNEIDRNLPPEMSNDPAYWTVEHDPPLSRGGDLLRDIKGGAHKGCNSSEGAKLLHNVDGLVETSRFW